MGLRIAIFGQAPFGREVTERLADAGHEIVGVYAPPAGGRADPLATLAEEQGFTLHRHKRFRSKGTAIPEIVEEYAKKGVSLDAVIDAARAQAAVYEALLAMPGLSDAVRARILNGQSIVIPSLKGADDSEE